MKKRTLLLAVSLCSLSILVSCGEKAGQEEQKTSSPLTEPTVMEETTDPLRHDLDTYDFGGKDFTLFTCVGGGPMPGTTLTEELNGDVLNDAVYTRMTNVEQRVNVKFKLLEVDDATQMPNKFHLSVNSGDNAFDLAIMHTFIGVNSVVGDGLVKSWTDIPHIDLTAPYWAQSLNETLSIQGLLPIVSNDFIIPDTTLIAYNRTLAEKLGKEDLYQLVKDGKWTWDKLLSNTKDVTIDLNGDGIYDGNDQYGFAGEINYSLISALHSVGETYIESDADGRLQITPLSDKFVSVIQSVHDLLYGNPCLLWKDTAGLSRSKKNLPIDFKNGKVLFTTDAISTLPQYRDMEDDFGVLPYPKFDETQKSYYSASWDKVLVAPLTADEDRVGVVTELLAAESREIVFPAFFEGLLESKLARDEETIALLNLIIDSRVHDIAIHYTTGTIGDLLYTIRNLMYTGDTDAASLYASKIDSAQKTLDELQTTILENYKK